MVKVRCTWCGDDPMYMDYHDGEWGVPESDPQELFERLVLEGMQAGLSWRTILQKRAHMQKVFYGFQAEKIVRYGPRRLEHWLQDAGIIRHRGKLEAMISNARLFVDGKAEFSEWLWSFAPPYKPAKEVPAQTPESVAMSKALKQAGYRFVGPTICYAFMQSVGMVNDHTPACFRAKPCERLVKRQLRER